MCFELPKRVQISNFVDFFCLKSTLFEPQTFTQVLFSDTEGVWKVWGKEECSFPNQPPQNWSISFDLPKRVQISNFTGFFCLEGTLFQPKTFAGVLLSGTEELWKVWAKTEC